MQSVSLHYVFKTKFQKVWANNRGAVISSVTVNNVIYISMGPLTIRASSSVNLFIELSLSARNNARDAIARSCAYREI